MPKGATPTSEKQTTVPGLPFLEVGNASRARSGRTRVGVEQLKKLFDWWDAAQPSLKQLSARDVGLPVFKLAQELGLETPTNGNSFRANLQRKLDKLSFGGKTMFLSLRGTEGEKFRVSEETMIWFHPVPVSERSQPNKK